MSLPAAAQEQLLVKGWPFLQVNTEEPPQDLGADPIWGRLACPSLTRLNLLKRRSERFLLESIFVEQDQGVWKLRLKDDLKWWGGDRVSAQDLVNFLDQELKQIIFEKSSGLWKLPSFVITVESGDEVVVKFKEQPSFGVFALNEVPFWRKQQDSSSGLQYECAGPYKIKLHDQQVILEKVKNDKKTSVIRLVSHSSSLEAGKKTAQLEFRFGKHFPGNPWNRMPDESIECHRKIDLPIVTIINWDTSSGMAASSEVRKALTQLTPRGAILRAGSGNLGDLVSAPILRGHPGYNKAVLVRSFSLEQASTTLNNLGYKRKNNEQARKDPKGKVVKMMISSERESHNLEEKALSDGFASVGIALNFLQNTANASTYQVDGELLNIKLPWPGSDFLSDFHSHSKQRPKYFSFKDRELDRLLEVYALSLSHETPQFEVLQKIHKKLYDIEPFTVIMQHQACLIAGKGHKIELPPIKIRDPDWFWELVD